MAARPGNCRSSVSLLAITLLDHAVGDGNYLSVLDAADAYMACEGQALPMKPTARDIGPGRDCVIWPLETLNLVESGISTIVWTTGYALDFGWLKLDVFDAKNRPVHQRGVADVPGLYFLGLPWLSRRASPFICGVWHDAEYLAEHIAKRKSGST